MSFMKSYYKGGNSIFIYLFVYSFISSSFFFFFSQQVGRCHKLFLQVVNYLCLLYCCHSLWLRIAAEKGECCEKLECLRVDKENNFVGNFCHSVDTLCIRIL